MVHPAERGQIGPRSPQRRAQPRRARTMNTETTTLVIGATGKTGRRVVERLRARNLPVRIGSRSSETPFDWDKRETWAPALRGVGAVYVAYYPDLAADGAA